MELVARLKGLDGSALANFGDTFEVELSGVPEPTGLSLLGLGSLLTIRRRRRRTNVHQ